MLSPEQFDLYNEKNESSQLVSLRKKITDLAKEYFETKYPKTDFEPGKTFIPSSGKVLDTQDVEYLINASLDFWLTAGRFSNHVEKHIHSYLNPDGKGILVNSGSSANLVAISALGSPLLNKSNLKPLEKGDEVITVAAGFPTTVSPIIQNGWKPVFIDVDLETLNALPEMVMAAKTNKTRAVVLAHTIGNPYRADVISEWCKKEDLYLVEDCCDALGSKINGTTVGSFGDFGTLSFYPAHHVTSGEGGAVIAKNIKLKKIAESLRDWGRDCWCEPGRDNTCGKRFSWQLGGLPFGYDHKFIYSQQGYNLKLTDMQSSVLMSQLYKLEDFIEQRKANWIYLNNAFLNSPILSEHFQVVQATPETEPSWFGFIIHCKPHIQREPLLEFLNEKKIGTRLVFAGDLTKQPSYENIDYQVIGDLKNTDTVMKQTFWVSCYPGLTQERMDYMVESFEKGVQAQVG